MTKKVVTIQENGQVTIPMSLRKRYGLKKGDVVVFEETEDGLLLGLKESMTMKLLDDIGNGLKAKGITLEELIESGRDAREDIIKEKYNLEAGADA